MIYHLSPTLLLLALIALASAALVHTLWGKRWRQIPLYILAAFCGCLIGYFANIRIIPTLPTPAGVPILESFIAAWVCLFIASRLRV
jgi:uncharacterized membrane protein YjjP (DUF1212 family)